MVVSVGSHTEPKLRYWRMLAFCMQVTFWEPIYLSYCTGFGFEWIRGLLGTFFSYLFFEFIDIVWKSIAFFDFELPS